MKLLSASRTGRDVGVRAAPAIVRRVRRAEKNGKAGRAEKNGRIGTGETSGTGGTSETSGMGGSASQSQRMHGAGYVGAIVGQVGRVRVRAKASECMELGMWGRLWDR